MSEYTIDYINDLNFQLAKRVSSLGRALMQARRYKLISEESTRKDLVRGEAMRYALKDMIDYNVQATVGFKESVYEDVHIMYEGHEYNATRTEKIVDRVGETLKIQICDSFTMLDRVDGLIQDPSEDVITTCKYVYRNYFVDANYCEEFDKDALIKNIQIFNHNACC